MLNWLRRLMPTSSPVTTEIVAMAVIAMISHHSGEIGSRDPEHVVETVRSLLSAKSQRSGETEQSGEYREYVYDHDHPSPIRGRQEEDKT